MQYARFRYFMLKDSIQVVGLLHLCLLIPSCFCPSNLTDESSRITLLLAMRCSQGSGVNVARLRDLIFAPTRIPPEYEGRRSVERSLQRRG